MLGQFLKTDETFFQEKTIHFMKDLGELITSATEALELYNSLISDQLGIFNASMGNRMNEVMKVLTVFASIFIPLTFLAGIYGMNFEYMPELKFKFAYPIFWLVAIGLMVGLFMYFKKKKWL